MSKIVCVIDDYPSVIGPEPALQAIEYLDQCKKTYPEFKCTIGVIPYKMTEELWKPLVERSEWIRASIHGFNHLKKECRSVRIGEEDYHRMLSDVINNPMHHWNSKFIKAPWEGYGPDYMLAAHKLGYVFGMPERYNMTVAFRYGLASRVGGHHHTPDFKSFFRRGHHDHIVMFTHTWARNNKLGRRKIKRRFRYLMEQSRDYAFAEDLAEPIFYKLNLGCGPHVIEGWQNLDPRNELDENIIQWEWNQPLPYQDESCIFALIQHSLMYCDIDNYKQNLMEIHRAMSPFGRLLIKEDNNLKWIWRGIGTQHSTGTIRSNTNLEIMSDLLKECGFTILSTDNNDIMQRYGDIVNRQRKMKRDIIYCIEAAKGPIVEDTCPIV